MHQQQYDTADVDDTLFMDELQVNKVSSGSKKKLLQSTLNSAQGLVSAEAAKLSPKTSGTSTEVKDLDVESFLSTQNIDGMQMDLLNFVKILEIAFDRIKYLQNADLVINLVASTMDQEENDFQRLVNEMTGAQNLAEEKNQIANESIY